MMKNIICTRPVKKLKNFKIVILQPGEKQIVTFNLMLEDLKFYNSDLVYDWEPGVFKIYISTSSADVKEVEFIWNKQRKQVYKA